MLHRSTSSRRRRASRSVTGPSQTSASTSAQQQQLQQPAARSRRASLASSEPAAEAPRLGIDRQRSPRGSCVPNIALDSEDHTPDEMFSRRLLPDPEQFSASRLSLAPDATRSSRNSLLPDEWTQGARSPRGSLVPQATPRSPRHSLVPEPQSLSPRNSLVPLDGAYGRGPRTALLPEAGRSPRHSLVPESAAAPRSPRGSLANIDFAERSPRGSVCPELAAAAAATAACRSPRGSVSPMDLKERSPRGSIASECASQSPRGSVCPEPGGRSPRGSVAPYEALAGRSPRGSVAGHRGSLGGVEDEPPAAPAARSPRGSIGAELERSPRGSLCLGQESARRPWPGQQVYAPAQQEPRRHSQDHGAAKSRTSSGSSGAPAAASGRGGAGAAQAGLAYGWPESRRPSSSVSQVSGDESRRLCEGAPYLCKNVGGLQQGPGAASGPAGPVGVAAYGSLVFQLKDAHLEASGSCDFALRALRVVGKTTPVTVFLALLSAMPIVMLILGVQFVRDCPREPHIPVYMLVGGSLGSIRMFWTLYSQIRSRRPEVLTVPGSRSQLSPTGLASIALSCFLVGWFALGNYWILSIRWPDYAPTLFEPNRWCHKTLYVFSLLHLAVVYLVMLVSLLIGLGLLFCRILACPWPERYK
ncbi:uncharacterized protein LOC131675471 [Phymastichus coffea]|uniref:uncharacterized protein LOC131675471 n=1 Tax=Phymastichus coffea TaxID=108790 RepID=UPI00273AAEEB|nr:uncharacterized protein LOC131675471 [Phymastichus coffea]XP_058810521.1 uncharacterized protein LOC131675471 [Phymastichus coffea]